MDQDGPSMDPVGHNMVGVDHIMDQVSRNMAGEDQVDHHTKDGVEHQNPPGLPQCLVDGVGPQPSILVVVHPRRSIPPADPTVSPSIV